MKKTQASGTAIGAAAVRAIESEKPANERICYDPFARRFIDPLVYLLIKDVCLVWRMAHKRRTDIHCLSLSVYR